MDAIKLRAVQRGMEGVIDYRGERPSGSLSAGGSAHGATITEKKDIGRMK